MFQEIDLSAHMHVWNSKTCRGIELGIDHHPWRTLWFYYSKISLKKRLKIMEGRKNTLRKTCLRLSYTPYMLLLNNYKACTWCWELDENRNLIKFNAAKDLKSLPIFVGSLSDFNDRASAAPLWYMHPSWHRQLVSSVKHKSVSEVAHTLDFT